MNVLVNNILVNNISVNDILVNNFSVNNIFAVHEGRAIKPGAEEPEKWRYLLFKQRLLVILVNDILMNKILVNNVFSRYTRGGQ